MVFSNQIVSRKSVIYGSLHDLVFFVADCAAQLAWGLLARFAQSVGLSHIAVLPSTSTFLLQDQFLS